jgi:hypothetical protein
MSERLNEIGGLPMFDVQPYGGIPGHVTSSKTSREAAISMLPNVGTKRRVIYDLLASAPSTDDELEAATGWRHQTVSARRRELVMLGLVVDSGKRRETSSGRAATVWEVLT